MKRIALLGSTGSIGKNTLKVARHLGEAVQVVALAAGSNIDLLEQQAKEFSPKIIAVYDKAKAIELQRRLPDTEVLGGMEGLGAVASYAEADFVVSAIAGTMGLIPTITAVKAGKDVGLANKEALVSGGALVMSLVKEHKTRLLPIDSEHSALFQCLNGEDVNTVHRLILTASGGPFRSYPKEKLQGVTVEDALGHPTWNMGPKVTIDSSTLMNKGLEVIEAHWLFGIPIDKIDVVVHPQSIIHSMVEFVDNSLIAQVGEPSMITPIQYAITYPERKEGSLERFNFKKYHTMQFLEPDRQTFRCLDLAYQAVHAGGSLPCYMNAANEVLVQRFLNGQISWLDIPALLDKLMVQHQVQPIDSIDAVLAIDALAREEASEKGILR